MTQRLKAIGLGAGAALALAGGALADSAFSAAEQRAIAASGLPRASVVSVKPDVVVAIRSRGTLSQGGGVVEGVVLQGEVVSGQAAQMLGYRSLRSTVNIDCARRRDMVVKMTVFTEPGAKGVAINRHVPGGWVQPSPDAYLSDVIRAVCA
ncbi:surface-adhesin E family protein, partial [Phenylobacterium sp.]|uniref:surface-adhesin E family protein n=1 Tax=Phenylobacterium sp. TaxID=1871053 RepID=UPI0035ADE746